VSASWDDAPSSRQGSSATATETAIGNLVSSEVGSCQCQTGPYWFVLWEETPFACNPQDVIVCVFDSDSGVCRAFFSVLRRAVGDFHDSPGILAVGKDVSGMSHLVTHAVNDDVNKNKPTYQSQRFVTCWLTVNNDLGVETLRNGTTAAV
jgi:hypothetical protein